MDTLYDAETSSKATVNQAMDVIQRILSGMMNMIMIYWTVGGESKDSNLNVYNAIAHSVTDVDNIDYHTIQKSRRRA